MTVQSPKVRSICFRLSENDYECLQALCTARGVDSLSDFVRESMRCIVHNSNVGLLDLMGIAFSHFGRTGPALAQASSQPKESSDKTFETITALMQTLCQKTDSLDREIKRLALQVNPAVTDRKLEVATSQDSPEGARHATEGDQPVT